MGDIITNGEGRSIKSSDERRRLDIDIDIEEAGHCNISTVQWIVEILLSHQRISGDFLQMGGTHIWRDQKEDKSNFKGQNIYFWTHIVSFQQSL